MFFKVSLLVLLFSLVLWHLHENYTAQFMAVTRSIPYLTPLMIKIHSYLGSGTKKNSLSSEELFTSNDLLLYNGEAGSKGLYISVLGKVFDVESGRHHYEVGGAYHVFAGRDASRAFVTGEFEIEQASDDVLDLSLSDLLSLEEWLNFYDKSYTYKGKLIGRYYTTTGEKTDYHKEFDKKVREGKTAKKSNEADKRKFPPCNTEWSADKGSRVWCTPRSGGVDRDWAGVPRKLYEIGTDKYKCVCINLPQLENPDAPQYSRRHNLEAYHGCDVNSTSCTIVDK